jgi:hypothetical protein
MGRLLTGAVACAALCVTASAQAALIVNAARPITDRINVNLIAVADDDGTDSTGGTFGTPANQAEVFGYVDVIFAQAGVDVNFSFRSGTYNSSFARIGAPPLNNPRPQTDLNAMVLSANVAGGVLSPDPNTVNVFLVTIVPGFSQLGPNASAGLAMVGDNGIAYYGGSDLLKPTFTTGRELLAGVLAHEIGHNLGLSHNSTAFNLMQSGGPREEKGQRLDAGQIATILGSRFTVAAPQTLPGDFNGDRQVDGDDLLVWQRGGSPRGMIPEDLALWRANFGRVLTVDAATPVPEPRSLVLISLAAWLIVGRGSLGPLGRKHR